MSRRTARALTLILVMALTLSAWPSGTSRGDPGKDGDGGTVPTPVFTMQPSGRIDLDARGLTSRLFGGLPDWLTRVRGEFTWDSETGSRFALETIQPVWQAPEQRHTLFLQGRFSAADGEEILNLGLGWRYLDPSGAALFGINGFYDHSFPRDHRRLGLGLEALGRYLTWRANGYLGISGWRDVADNQEERALDGFDSELEGALPYLPWARVALGYYYWKRRTGRDLHGLRSRLRLQLTSFLEIEGGYAVDREEDAGFVKLRLRLADADRTEHAASRSLWGHSPLPARDLRRHVLDFVERSNTIAVERRSKSGGGRARVIVARGS